MSAVAGAGARSSADTYWMTEGARQWIDKEALFTAAFSGLHDDFLAALGDLDGRSVVEFGCGSGGMATRLAERSGARGSVLGVDIAAPLIANAEARRDPTMSQLRFLQADVEELALPEAHADLVCSLFTLMFLKRLPTTLERIRRWLRPGGEVAFATWAPMSFNPWFGEPFEALDRAGGRGRQTSPEGGVTFALSDPAHAAELLRGAGFRNVRSEIRDGEVRMGGLASATRLALGFGPIAARSLDASDDAAFIADLSEVLARRDSPDGVVYRARYLCFRGQA